MTPACLWSLFNDTSFPIVSCLAHFLSLTLSCNPCALHMIVSCVPFQVNSFYLLIGLFHPLGSDIIDIIDVVD